MFGEPRGTTAAKLMHAALKSGYFSREEQPYEGHDGPCTRSVFTALNRGGNRHTSWWDGINRVNSVWKLAEVVR
jgi:hypothetical protein